MRADEAGPAPTAVSLGNAATLTYTVAPHPFSYQTLFAILLAAAPTRRERAGRLMSWLWSPGGGSAERRIKQTQTAFARCFSRQLEVRSSPVVLSVACALLSYGQPHWGMLWATTHGLYFRSAARGDRFLFPLKRTSETQRWAETTEDHDEAWGDEAEAVREVLPFKDVVSLLPSVALAVVEDGAPYVTGIPNPVVRPNALQVFTVSPNQIYQFVYLHTLTVIPPSSLPAMEGNFENVLLQHEYDTIKSLPSEFDAVTFCALTERLWEARLKSLQIPSCRDGVAYAASH
ncbi:uncharacterized protein Tco025E_07833 [Trypanosoma conorhini]|uniref:Uncharacterized protein n=1 Tax=Trypanosoma conorhini TaxID=83891 RepID=A0A422NIF1_9TRYP|nr:uncharacterized protein Tco025E_07833 [Trypanosoma conorhini]RNF05164.1 hypothetical protein Tco025E_07833 [Trypanosoma conorhini]